MAHIVMRRLCPQCQQIKSFQRPEQVTCSYRCATERKRVHHMPPLQGFGVLDARERAIYERGWVNGLRTGQKRGHAAGRRLGWREALAEAPDTRWTAKRRAA